MGHYASVSRGHRQKIRRSSPLRWLRKCAVDWTMNAHSDVGPRVFTAPERVDAYNTRELVGPIREAIDAGVRCVVLDLSKTQSMDSTALGALVQLLKLLRAEGGELRLAGVGDAVSRVLSITRLDEVFAVYRTLDAACIPPRA